MLLGVVLKKEIQYQDYCNYMMHKLYAFV